MISHIDFECQWAGVIIGAYFFKDDEDRNATFNGKFYRGMITHNFYQNIRAKL